jgi:hypothetical protein
MSETCATCKRSLEASLRQTNRSLLRIHQTKILTAEHITPLAVLPKTKPSPRTKKGAPSKATTLTRARNFNNLKPWMN